MIEAGVPVDIKERLGQARVSGLFEYPIKSCAGQSLDVGKVVARGFRHDRELMVISEAPLSKRPRSPEFTGVSNAFVTQGEFPRMALIVPHITDDEIRLSAPGIEDLVVPIIKEGDSREVAVWRDRNVQAVDQGNEAAEWFGTFLESDTLRLVGMPGNYVRQVDQAFAPRETDQVGFADGYPFLLLSEESLADLNRRIKERKLDHASLPMNRFRPNIVLSGSGIPYGEDMMSQVQIGEVVFDVCKPCVRCMVTQTDQALGQRAGGEPLATLATYRGKSKASGRGVDVEFAQNLAHQNKGVIRLGDSVKVLATK